LFCSITFWLILGCELNQPSIDPQTQLDGPLIYDTTSHTLSDSLPAPTPDQLNMPVIICVHGFTATTYEWEEWSNYIQEQNQSNPNSPILVSRVLLGGHGRDYNDFKKSTWGGWQAPVVEEYEKLKNLGYKNISFAGSSTGGALLLELLGKNYFTSKNNSALSNLFPKNFILIDPIVYPSAEILSLIDLVGWLVRNSESSGTLEESKHWYTNRPAEALQELLKVITRVRLQLEEGYKLPPGSYMRVYKARTDKSASPLSALSIKKGLRDAQGKEVDIRMIATSKHVFTRLAGRSSINSSDTALQKKTFQEMYKLLLPDSIQNQ